ncbi:MAG: dimethylsulfoniopropionate demethylase [Anaerolineae bacterium]
MFEISIVQRTRPTVYHDSTVKAGVKAFTVYNHTLLPTYYASPEEDYWNLINNVSMWDVACERQVEITGPDAFKLVTLMTPRNISKCKVGQGKYVPIVDHNGGMINDPILLKLAEDHYWLSIADTDVALWAKGLALGFGLDVNISEPDVYPLAIQGPNADKVCASLLGDWIYDLKYFWFREFDLNGIPLVVQRSGWSKQGGLELYLRDGSKGNQLWEMVEEAGKPFDIKPGAPSTIERIEHGLFSQGNDMTIDNNPYEVGLGKYCAVDQEAEFIGKAALQRIKAEGASQKLVGVMLPDVTIKGAKSWIMLTAADGSPAGKITSLAYSPRLGKTIAFAMVPIIHTDIGTQLIAHTEQGETLAVVHETPFIK